MFTIQAGLVAALLLAPSEGGAVGDGLRFYVAPDGDDGFSGSHAQRVATSNDGPWATVAHAQQAIRSLRKQGRLAAPVTVLVRGQHRLQAPLVFTPEDSGTPQCPVTYGCQPGQSAVLCGGMVISKWQRDDRGRWIADLPEVAAGKLYFRQLFVGTRRATRARSPNQGFYRVAGLVDPKPGAKWNQGVDAFRFLDRDIQAWRDLTNVEAVVFHSWNTSRVRIASVDAAQRVVRFTGPTIFRPLGWDPQQRYYVENAAELLDEPGEWYLDAASGRLTYWPLPGEDPDRTVVVAPRLSELVRLEGDPEAGKWVEHLRLVGLQLEHADWTLGPRGYGDPQAAVTVPAAVTANGARHCAVEDCRVAHVGGYGIWFQDGCQHNRIVGNQVHDLGAGGIRLGNSKMPTSDSLTSSDNLISNNYLHDGGHVYAGAVGLWLAHACRNEISHHEIHSFNYSGMSIGWNWSDAPTRTLENRIEWNHIHHVCRGMLSDAGGIYTLGRQTGTVIRGNVIHDVFPYMGRPAMAWGLYFDQASNGLTVEKNLVYNTLTGGVMNTGSHGNTICNNVFALSAWQAAWRYKFVQGPPSRVQRNIFYLTQGELFHDDEGRNDTQSLWDFNLYWRTDGLPMEFYDADLRQWQAKGLDQHGLVADPRFRDPARGDFTLAEDSPARALGIESLQPERAGLIGPPEWVQLPRQVQFAPTVLAPAPGSLVVHEDFEAVTAGTRPQSAQAVEEGRGDSIGVVEGVARSGRKSLKFTDVSGLKGVYNPHLYYLPHYRRGTARVVFDLRLEPGAIAAHEWRDQSRPYLVGPSLQFRAGAPLTAQGQKLVDLPEGQWVHVEIVCKLGPAADGSYELTVTLPDRDPQHWTLQCAAEKFNRLEWLGFTSLANAATAWHLDNLVIQWEPTPP